MAIQGNIVAKSVFLLGLALLSCVAQCVKLSNHRLLSAGATVFDVTKSGAKADGRTDNCQAFTDAWNKACKCGDPAKILVPNGTFVVKEVTFQGPCVSPIVFEVQGTIKATPKISSTTQWFLFQSIDGLVINGGGTFDGQGPAVWNSSKCASKAKNSKCELLPDSIKFIQVKNAEVSDISSVNSKAFHMHITVSGNITLHNLELIAPDDSPNTDGIHLSESSFITIQDSKIGTGDDCISIGQGSMNVSISNIACGPGHGISIGSLGKYQNEQDVMGISITNCTFSNTTNGARIKTWRASPQSQASNIFFDNIVMNDVQNPILIDQNYGNKADDTKSEPSNVKLSDVHFKNIRGTSATEVAVALNCSSKFPCEGVELVDIDLASTISKAPAAAQCNNANVKIGGTVTPAGCQ